MNSFESLRGFVGLVLRWWWLLVLCAAVAAAIAYGTSRLQEPVYEARATLIVGRSLQDANLDPREIDSNERLARTYANIARRQPVLQGVVDALDLNVRWQALRKQVRANPVENTQLFEVVAEAGSPEDAKAIADETATQLIALGSSRVLSIIERGQASSRPVRPQVLTNTFVAGIFGLFLGLGTVFVWERYTGTLKSADDVSGELGLMFLGAIRRGGHVKVARLRPGPHGHRPLTTADDYRVIRSNIEFASLTRPAKSIMVTNPSRAGGKTTTVVNLGVAMAQAGLKTILVDADMRQPMLHEIFDIPQQPGLTDLLRWSDPDIETNLNPTSVENLFVMTAGTLPSHLSDPLDSPRFEEVLGTLNAISDIVIFDSPSTLGFADAVVLAKYVDGVVLVLEAGRTRRDDARRSILVLERAGAKLLGGVLNSVPRGMAYDGYDVASV